MLDPTLLGLNTTGWLKESEREQREYLVDSRRSILQACINQVRERTAGEQALCAC